MRFVLFLNNNRNALKTFDRTKRKNINNGKKSCKMAFFLVQKLDLNESVLIWIIIFREQWSTGEHMMWLAIWQTSRVCFIRIKAREQKEIFLESALLTRPQLFFCHVVGLLLSKSFLAVKELSWLWSHFFSANWTGVTATFVFERIYSYFIYHVYAPSVIVVILSWVGFVLPRDTPPARVTLAVTAVLTIVTILTMLNSSIAKVGRVGR